jgi:oxygen-dependent protoporphyrinogen oxidase
VDALASTPSVEVRTSTPVGAVERSGSGYDLQLVDGGQLHVDAVVVALPPPAAAAVLGSLVPAARAPLATLSAATVATVVAVYPPGALAGTAAAVATGMLVGSRAGRLLRSATFLGAKWAHLQHPDHSLIRLSAGRAGQEVVAGLDDGELVSRLHGDLAEAIGLDPTPSAALVHRWPDALAQLEVGHLGRVATIRDALASHPRVALAGAGYDGLGITRCVESGERAAARVHGSLDRATAR